MATNNTSNKGSIHVTKDGDINIDADKHGMQLSIDRHGVHAQARNKMIAEILATLHMEAPAGLFRKFIFRLFHLDESKKEKKENL